MGDEAARARRQRYRERHPDRVAASRRKYAATEARRESNKRYLQGDVARASRAALRVAARPEQKAAWIAVEMAVRQGRLTVDPCWCGRTDTHAHHHHGYDKPLDVVWLCALHHRQAHRDAAETP